MLIRCASAHAARVACDMARQQAQQNGGTIADDQPRSARRSTSGTCLGIRRLLGRLPRHLAAYIFIAIAVPKQRSSRFWPASGGRRRRCACASRLLQAILYALLSYDEARRLLLHC